MAVEERGGDHDQIQELLYYLNMMVGRRFSGSLTLWMIDGRITRSTFQKLRQLWRRAGVPIDATGEEAAHAESHGAGH